jgi:hypothetical protein
VPGSYSIGANPGVTEPAQRTAGLGPSRRNTVCCRQSANKGLEQRTMALRDIQREKEVQYVGEGGNGDF